jgi:hypothetical protein
MSGEDFQRRRLSLVFFANPLDDRSNAPTIKGAQLLLAKRCCRSISFISFTSNQVMPERGNVK